MFLHKFAFCDISIETENVNSNSKTEHSKQNDEEKQQQTLISFIIIFFHSFRLLLLFLLFFHLTLVFLLNLVETITLKFIYLFIHPYFPFSYFSTAWSCDDLNYGSRMEKAIYCRSTLAELRR